MALALQKDQTRLQTSYAYASRQNRNNRKHPAPLRYLTPSRSTQAPVTVQPADSSSLQHIALVSQFIFKAILIGLMSIGFLYCTSAIVGSSTSVLLKILGLSIWSCGFVPLTYYLWNSKLAS